MHLLHFVKLPHNDTVRHKCGKYESIYQGKGNLIYFLIVSHSSILWCPFLESQKNTHTYLYNANMQRSLTNSQLFKYSITFSLYSLLNATCATHILCFQSLFFFLSCRNISRIKIILNQIMIAIIVTGASIGSTQLIFYWLNAAVAIVILVVEPSTTGQ